MADGAAFGWQCREPRDLRPTLYEMDNLGRISPFWLNNRQRNYEKVERRVEIPNKQRKKQQRYSNLQHENHSYLVKELRNVFVADSTPTSSPQQRKWIGHSGNQQGPLFSPKCLQNDPFYLKFY